MSKSKLELISHANLVWERKRDIRKTFMIPSLHFMILDAEKELNECVDEWEKLDKNERLNNLIDLRNAIMKVYEEWVEKEYRRIYGSDEL